MNNNNQNYNDNLNYNENVNINININNNCYGSCYRPPREDNDFPINPSLLNVVYRTKNGLILIDNGGLVQQVNQVVVPNSDRWDIVPDPDSRRRMRIINVATGRFVGLESISMNDGIRIVTKTGTDETTSWFVSFYNPPTPIIPPPPTGTVFTNGFSRKVITVPGNTSAPETTMIQTTREVIFPPDISQLFDRL